MLGISFGELLVIFTVGLIVLGPDKLPRVARGLGLLVGHAQRYLSKFKEELLQEPSIGALQRAQDEIHASLRPLSFSLTQSVKEIIPPPLNPPSSTAEDLSTPQNKFQHPHTLHSTNYVLPKPIRRTRNRLSAEARLQAAKSQTPSNSRTSSVTTENPQLSLFDPPEPPLQ